MRVSALTITAAQIWFFDFGDALAGGAPRGKRYPAFR
jgi:hypothetical protein